MVLSIVKSLNSTPALMKINILMSDFVTTNNAAVFAHIFPVIINDVFFGTARNMFYSIRLL